MSPFKNKEVDETGMPPEVHEFYKAEHRERVGVAWLLAFATLVVTVGLALGGFMGGRAIYRKVAKKDKNTPTTQVATKAAGDTTQPSASGSSSNNTTPSTNSSNSGQNGNQATNTPKPTPTTPAPKPKPNPQLPHTGPDGND